jgi:ArsR family transcriptional regulator
MPISYPCAPGSIASDVELDAEQLALLCKALGHPARVRILKYLAEHGTCFFGNLSDVIDLAPSTVSQHVSVLKEAGLIRASANIQRMCYCVEPERIALLRTLIAAL